MKIIDLLNKIANGEEVPKKIKVFGGIYYLCKGDSSKQLYFSEKQGYGGIGLKFNTSQINEEVEIIEDNKIEYVGKEYNLTELHNVYPEAAELLREIKELRDEINKLKENK